jgi:hypothetical protein
MKTENIIFEVQGDEGINCGFMGYDYLWSYGVHQRYGRKFRLHLQGKINEDEGVRCLNSMKTINITGEERRKVA